MDIQQINSELKRLVQSKWWEILVEHIETSIKHIENEILEGKEEWNKVKYTDYDIMRETRKMMYNLKWYPDFMIEHTEKQLGNDLDEEDPYIKN